MNLRAMRTLLYRLVLAGLILQLPTPGFTAEDELCAAFKSGKVDSALLETMLSAAEQGHLYRIEQSTSRVGFCVDSQLARIEGKFTKFQGGMTLNPVSRANGQAMVLIKTASVETKSAFIKGMITGENFFDVERNPEILFVSRSMSWTSKDTAELKGDLTMRGITRPVIFHVTLVPLEGGDMKKADKFLVKASAGISRSEFGMKSLTSLISDDVHLCMTVRATKYEAIKL